MTTLAALISARYHDDGQRWHDADGVYMEDALRVAGARHERSDEHDSDRWTLPDGSIITIAGGGWDYGYAECWCWQDGGHTDECRDAASGTGSREVTP